MSASEATAPRRRVRRKRSSGLQRKQTRLACGFRLDLLVEREIIVEVKATERIERVHLAQLRHYLKQLRLNLGLLINFNVVHLRDGIKRFVNGTGWK